MKKIYSYVLMAAMLLIGTNAWATTRTASSATEFENAWKAAVNGDVIQLTNDITINKTLWLGTANMNDAAKSITLDLNGWILTNDQSDLAYMFVITHGELNVITSVAGGKIIQNGAKNEELFRVTGSTYKNINPKTAESGYFSHLTIGEGVTVDAKVKNAIVIDEIDNVTFGTNGKTGANKAYYTHADCAWATAGIAAAPSTKPYSAQVYSGKGVANGVRIDVHGIVRGNKYAMKANGNLGSPSSTPAASLAGFYADPAQTIAYAINAADVDYSPFIHIYGTADLRVPADNNESKKPVAIYCSGYARWMIEGTCVGATAVYVKSGELDIHDATIESNYTGTYQPPTATNSGVTGTGSAIAIESNANYSGDIDVTVSGDTHVTATNGYAIEEAVTNATDTKVDAITINGGTFDGGTIPVDPKDPSAGTTQGTIIITSTTAENETTTITVVGGEVHGTGEDNVNIGGQTLEEFLSDAGTDTHITTIDDGNGGTTMVITEGAAPTGKANVAGNNGSSVKWKHADPDDDSNMEETLTADLSLTELDITQTGYYQTLTIAEGVTLQAERVILGAKAKIIVEAGGKFLVTGEQGITANLSDNIILKTSSTAQALFLVNPAVNANKHPKAQVQMISKGYYDNVNDKYIWQRFGVPAYEATMLFSDIVKDVPSAYMKLVADEWVEIPVGDWGTEKLVPFTTYAVTTNQTTPGGLYTFSCSLVGNSDATLPLTGKWNYYANSYTAPISISDIINDYNTKYTNVSGTIYLHDAASGDWYEINNATPYVNPEYPTVINPMHAFIIQKRSNSGSNPVVNYKDEVYDPTIEAFAPAPARLGSAPFATALVEIVAADGTKDQVSLLEGEQFSAEFDNTYDATKLMTKEQSYIYANGADDKLGIIASNNLEGTTIGMEVKEQTSFLMTIKRVNGMNYAIRDMLTGTEIELTEGATYMFSVPANTTIDGRFQVVGLHRAPTAIDNVEEICVPVPIISSYSVFSRLIVEIRFNEVAAAQKLIVFELVFFKILIITKEFEKTQGGFAKLLKRLAGR